MPLPEELSIPSELIEPFLFKFLMMQIEAVGCGLTAPKQAKEYLKGVEYFISSFGGIHCRFAVSNEYRRFIDVPDDELFSICKTAIQ